MLMLFQAEGGLLCWPAMDTPGRGFLVVCETEKANLLSLPPPSRSRLIRVPFPTPEGPQMTRADGRGLLGVGAASAAAGVDCSAPMWPSYVKYSM
jgi:hypothetical protein